MRPRPVRSVGERTDKRETVRRPGATTRQLGGTDESALLIDESGITKEGNRSVGVARQ
jgi:SRSO17 transposase